MAGRVSSHNGHVLQRGAGVSVSGRTVQNRLVTIEQRLGHALHTRQAEIHPCRGMCVSSLHTAWYPGPMAATKKPKATAKPASRIKGRSARTVAFRRSGARLVGKRSRR